MAEARAVAPAPRQLALGCAWAWGRGALRRAWRAWRRGQAGGGRAIVVWLLWVVGLLSLGLVFRSALLSSCVSLSVP